MSDWGLEILETIENSIKSKNFKGIKIYKIKSPTPLILTYEEVDIGESYGDKIYVHPLFVSDLISLDENVLSDSQSFVSSSAYNSPQFSAIIEGSIPDFIKKFYQFFKNWQSVFLLKEGDMVAVLELKNNAYLILQKVIER